ncbi:hypothetical protein IDJ77_04090 [Mucilaginibacter sp. ZT4R22]|uniref:Uncharacterized protein n=1 Tax=Mucilaginibacter pankratovii TaxID=2772110 RepID=A0ABR7WKY0_9SPHI|nr:hypothetical protein [Mucilaginibacter pankratovii]MBD1362982.1 hypothetical protein [Mucilaginibacter pankratovii]
MHYNDRSQGILVTRKGEFQFEYFLHFNNTYKFDTYAFLIWAGEGGPDENAADFSLLIMNDDIHLKVIDLFMKHYSGNGIAIAIILKARELFGKKIISSSNTNKSFTSEANWPEAIQRVWQPLVDQGLAHYDAPNDHYVLVDVI